MIHKKLLLCSLFCSLSLFGEDVTNHLNQESQEVGENLTFQEIQGVVIASHDDMLEGESKEAIDIRIDNAHGLKQSLEPYLGKSITEQNVQNMKKSIEKYFITQNRSLVSVKIPEQKVRSGKIVYSVDFFKVGDVSVSGNRWFTADAIKTSYDLRRGEVLQEKDLMNAAAWVNRNPFIYTNAVLSPGAGKSDANIEILTKDRFPARIYVGTDNTGSSVTGSERFFLGTNFCLGRGNLFTYQFTSGYNFPEYLTHFGNWTMFLPWKNELIFFGAYGTIHPKISDFESSGEDVQISMRYNIPFNPLFTSFQHMFSWGADYKNSNSSLFFVGAATNTPVDQKATDLFQFYLAYQLTKTWARLNVDFKFETLFSPFIFFPNQSSADYSTIRPRANVRYWYSRMGLGTVYKMPMDFVFASVFRGQVASGALLPSEQYGLGGFSTVRCYQENIYTADNAVIGNFELHFPTWYMTRCRDRATPKILALVFVDIAYGSNWHDSSSFRDDAFLMGAGPGIRFNIDPYLTARFDYGFRIHNTFFGNEQIGRAHFSATLSY